MKASVSGLLASAFLARKDRMPTVNKIAVQITALVVTGTITMFASYTGPHLLVLSSIKSDLHMRAPILNAANMVTRK